MNILQRFKAWRTRRFWKARHIEFLRTMAANDWRWLAGVPIANMLAERYYAATSDGWHAHQFTPVDKFRDELTKAIQEVVEEITPWLRYDSKHDELIIHDRRYSGQLFREDGFLGPPGITLRIIDNAGDTITVSRAFNLEIHLARQRSFSERTFGPGARTKGVIDHIRKELLEIEAAPADLSEWIDVVILALDGAWRTGATPEQIIAALVAKQDKNEARQWPDWRTAAPDQAIEHVRHDLESIETSEREAR